VYLGAAGHNLRGFRTLALAGTDSFFHSLSVPSFIRCGLGTLIGADPECCHPWVLVLGVLAVKLLRGEGCKIFLFVLFAYDFTLGKYFRYEVTVARGFVEEFAHLRQTECESTSRHFRFCQNRARKI
jgi:hypothetical protein